MLLTILAALVVLGVLIFVHELGHFLAAKAVGIGTPKFSIGFGPATPLKFKYGEDNQRKERCCRDALIFERAIAPGVRETVELCRADSGE